MSRTLAFSFSFSSSPFAGCVFELFLNMEKNVSLERGRDYHSQQLISALFRIGGISESFTHLVSLGRLAPVVAILLVT